MIGHQTISKDPNTEQPLLFCQIPKIELIVAFSGEHRLPVMAALNNVVGIASDKRTRIAWH